MEAGQYVQIDFVIPSILLRIILEMYKHARGFKGSPNFAEEPKSNAGRKTTVRREDVKSKRALHAERAVRRRLARFKCTRRDVEQFLSHVASNEIRGSEVPLLPRPLVRKLQRIVTLKGGVLVWAKSRPEYGAVKQRERARVRVANKIRRMVAKDRKKMAATKWKTKNRIKRPSDLPV